MVEALPAAAFHGAVRAAAVGEAVRILNKRLRRCVRKNPWPCHVEAELVVHGPTSLDACLTEDEVNAVLREFARAGWAAFAKQRTQDGTIAIVVRLPREVNS